MPTVITQWLLLTQLVWAAH